MQHRCRPGASPSSPRACPKAPTGSPKANPARPRSAGCSPSTASIDYRVEEGRSGARAAGAGHRRSGADRRDVPAGRGDGAGPRPGQHAGGRPRPGRDRAGGARRGQATRARQVRVTLASELAKGYPLIAAVGGAATPERAPRLIELEWGKAGDPRVAIIGKGVCFDSGGLDIKSGVGHAADEEGHGRRGPRARARPADHRREAAGPPPPAHPGGRKCGFRRAPTGPATSSSRARALFVEIDNTDAEGRLILADALARAAEDKPELIVDFATLTGAARIALGPELPALFANRDELAAAVAEAARAKSRTRCGGCRCGTPMTNAEERRRRSRQCRRARRWRAASPPRCSSSASCPTRSPGRTSIPMRGAIQPSRAVPRAATRSGLRAIFALLEGRYPPR